MACNLRNNNSWQVIHLICNIFWGQIQGHTIAGRKGAFDVLNFLLVINEIKIKIYQG